MKRLIHWSIDHHWIVIALSVLLLAAGAWTAREMPVDVFPGSHRADRHHPRRRATAWRPRRWNRWSRFRSRAPSTAPRACAASVRRPPSASASIWVEFDWGTDIYIARQLVAEKLALVAGTLPPQVERPVLAPISSIMGEILFFALSSDSVDPLTLRTVADTVVRRRLLAVPGRVAGDADRRRRAAVPGHRPSRGAARQRRLAHRAARRGPRRERERLGRHLHRGPAGVRAAGGRPRPQRRGDRRQRGRDARHALGARPRRRRRAAKARRSSAAKARATASRR